MKIKNTCTLLSAILLSISLMLVGNVQAAKVPDKVKQDIKKRISSILNKSQSDINVKSTPVKNLYQVTLDTNILYISSDAKYLFNGSLIDIETKTNLTNKATSLIVKEEIKKVSKKATIVYPAKNKVKHIITVFTDIDCPYCRKFHKEVPKLNAKGVEVRYLAFPRAGIGSASYDKSVSIWCAKNRAKAMDDAMQNKIVSKKCANSPVAQYLKLVQKFNVSGTPTIISRSGKVIPGYVPADKLIKSLNASD